MDLWTFASKPALFRLNFCAYTMFKRSKGQNIFLYQSLISLVCEKIRCSFAPIHVLETERQRSQRVTWENSISLWLLSDLLSCKDGTKTRLLQHSRTVMSPALALSTELHRLPQEHNMSRYIYSGSKQVLNSWSCAELCCTARYRERQRKRTKEKWS